MAKMVLQGPDKVRREEDGLSRLSPYTHSLTHPASVNQTGGSAYDLVWPVGETATKLSK